MITLAYLWVFSGFIGWLLAITRLPTIDMWDFVVMLPLCAAFGPIVLVRQL